MPASKKKPKKVKPKTKKKVVKKAKKKTVSKTKKTIKKSVKKTKRPVKKTARKPVKKSAKKTSPSPAPSAPTWHLPREGEALVGAVEDYLSHLEVILTTLKTPLAVGEMVSIRGFTTNTEQIVRSIQIEHAPVTQAASGQAVGIKVDEKVRKNDHIFKKA